MAGRKSKRWWILSAAVGSVVSMLGGGAKADLQWDNDPSTAGPQNGAGVWDTLNNNWLDSAGNQVFWNNGNAIFGGSAFTGTAATGFGGVIQLGENITAGNLTFN